MKKQLLKQFVGMLALLCCSAGMAATVTVNPSTTTPGIGDTFTVTVSGDFTGVNVGAATLGLTFDSAVVSVTGIALTGDAQWNGGGVFGPTPFLSGNEINLTAPNPPALAPTGTFDAFQITFMATGAGAANIFLRDMSNGGTGIEYWADADTFDPIPVTYTQASVTVVCSGPCISVADTVAPTNDHDIPFGNVTMGTTSAQTVTITNNGTADLVVGTLAQADPLAAPFSIPPANDMCSGQTLAPTVSCTVDVQFSPTALGGSNDSFDIPSNDLATGTVTVNVSGNGTPVAEPNIVVTDPIAPTNDNDIPFGDITVGTTSTQTVTVTNNGTADLNVGTLTSPAAPFSIANDGCSNQLLTPSASCHFDVQFQPIVASPPPYSSSFDIPSDDPDTATVTVTVSGTASVLTLPDIVVSDATIAFGNVTVGDAPTHTVTVTNNGLGPLHITGITTASAAPPFSIASDNCSNQTVAPSGGTCTFDVVFQPVAAVGSNDTVHIPSDDPDSPVTDVAVSGMGSTVPVPDITVTDSVPLANDLEVPFGSIEEHTTGHQSVTVTNDGQENLVIGQIATANPLAAPFSIDAANCSNVTLAHGESCTINLEFAAGDPADGTFNDSFDIPSNDPDEATVTVDVHGSAQPGVRTHGPRGSALDPATLLGLALLGFAVRRRQRRGV